MSEQLSSDPSTELFVDAGEEDSETVKEAPLATPNLSLVQENSIEEQEKQNVVTIFEVATEIEQMLQDIGQQFEKSDSEVSSKIEQINKKLNNVEGKIRKQ